MNEMLLDKSKAGMLIKILASELRHANYSSRAAKDL